MGGLSRLSHFTFLLALFTQVTPAIDAAPLSRRATDPASDPFYTPPSGWQSTSPGTVLNSRKVSTSYLTILPNLLVTSYQILYRTSGVNTTTPLATVATIFIPNVGRNASQLVGFATAEDSAYISCAPSYNYILGGSPTNAIVQFEELAITAALLQGWTVVSSDYEGPNSTFSAGRLEGHAVLDALRATLAFPSAGVASGAKVAQFGYSGGAIASGWASVLQPSYAPELNMVGYAYGGTPANLSSTLQYLDGGAFAGFAFGGVAGLIYAYPELLAYVNQVATAAGQSAIAYARSHCATDDITNFLFKSLLKDTTYTTAGPTLLSQPVVSSILAQNVIGAVASEIPSVPVYIYHSNTDEIIPIAGADAMVASFCAHGIKSLVYERDIGPSEHASLEVLGLPSVISFLTDRFAGKTPNAGCTTTNVLVPTSVSSTAFGTSLGSITLTGVMNTYLTVSLGTGDSIMKARVQSGGSFINPVSA
ncbi:LIP-domain-containing protein [Meredithblackwellia eburnea MCA 4105]